MTTSELIANQRKSLLIYAHRCGSISRACKAFGVSRTTFYKIKEQYLKTGSLLPRIRSKPRMPNQTSLTKKKILLKLVYEHPSWGPGRLSYELRQQQIFLKTCSVWYNLKRFGLNTKWKRLVYVESLKLEAQPLTERTLKVIKKDFSQRYQGHWPGHLVSLDTFYVGCLKGVGRIYQVTGIDIASRFGFAKLYTTHDQTATLDFLENSLIPVLYQNNITIEKVVTDNGTEFTGKLFNQCLNDYEMEHLYIPKGKPVCNGYVERFQRTIYEEFYQRTFRVKMYRTLASLQQDLDAYLRYYNFQRPHFGVNPKGALPIDVLKTDNAILQQRFKALL